MPKTTRSWYDFSPVDRAIDAGIARRRFPGAAWAVGLCDGELHSYTSGVANLERGMPLSISSIFRLMSMTKPVTAAAVMILVEQGQLDLNCAADEYLPELLEWQRQWPKQVTIKHLLTHTSGLEGDGFDLLGRPISMSATSLAQRVTQISEARLSWEPGSRFSYSPCSGYDLLSRIVELAAELPFDAFLQRAIFAPLGMRDTGFGLSHDGCERLVGLYSNDNDQFCIEQFDATPSSYCSGAAGLYGSVSDYVQFALMLAGDGTLSANRILSAQSVKEISGEQLPAGFAGIDRPGHSWGLGVRCVSDPSLANSPLPSGSFGWSGAYGTHFRIIPSLGLAAVFLSNLTTAGGADDPFAEQFERSLMQSIALS